MSTSPPPLVLHVWEAPESWNTLSIDPNCVAAILAIQLAVPGQYTVQAASTPDASPNGTLPYLTHGHHTVTTLPAILKYIANSELANTADLNGHLAKGDRAKNTAWAAHIESNLGSFLAYQQYVLVENWNKLTHPALVAKLPIPYRYYLPQRMRDSYKPRLEAAGLWGPHAAEEEAEPKTFAERQMKTREKLPELKFKQTFSSQKVTDKARSVLDTYVAMLENDQFLFADRPTSADLLLAAHVLLLTEPVYPDPLLQKLVTEHYPSLVQHAKHVQRLAFPQGAAVPFSAPASGPSLTSLIPWPRWNATRDTEASDEWKAVERGFAIQRWAWIGLAVASSVGYLWMYPLMNITWSRERTEEEEEDREEEDADSVARH